VRWGVGGLVMFSQRRQTGFTVTDSSVVVMSLRERRREAAGKPAQQSRRTTPCTRHERNEGEVKVLLRLA